MSNQSNKPLYGGQAVIEGVMMRGKNAFSVAVRDPDDNIVVHTEPLNPRIYNSFISRTPFLRGITMLWDALGLGMKALVFSAEVASDEEEEEEASPPSEPTKPDTDEASEVVTRTPSDIFAEPMMVGTVALSLLFSVGLFIATPAFIAGFFIRETEQNLFSNFVEGLVRLSLVIGYIWAIGFIPDIQRVFAYHGAEHKTINAYEAGSELTPQKVQTFPLEHPRCGTGFLLTVVIISILLFSLIPPLSEMVTAYQDRPSEWIINLVFRIFTRILFIPIVAGIAYEFLRFTAAHQDKRWVQIITRPNLALQKLTTREPELDMLEVAIEAFNQVRNVDLKKVESS
ncbi:MAG: DUF1385 domain-containing protein [Chloroflexota bacterium]